MALDIKKVKSTAVAWNTGYWRYGIGWVKAALMRQKNMKRETTVQNMPIMATEVLYYKEAEVFITNSAGKYFFFRKQ